MVTYIIHFNGGRPYKVEYSKAKRAVKVYAAAADGDDFEKRAAHTFSNIVRVMVGSAGDGSYDWERGNTVLVQLNKTDYVHISNTIVKFKPLSKIKKFASPIGNNDVPYPYAIDTGNRYYLFAENVMLLQVPENEAHDPYSYYYGGGESVYTVGFY